jgi:hypothetical protein
MMKQLSDADLQQHFCEEKVPVPRRYVSLWRRRRKFVRRYRYYKMRDMRPNARRELRELGLTIGDLTKGLSFTFGEEKHEKSLTEQRTLSLTANCSVLGSTLFRFNRTTASLFCLKMAASPKVSQNPNNSQNNSSRHWLFCFLFLLLPH